MRAPIFGLSTTPVTDIKSELRLQIDPVHVHVFSKESGDRISPELHSINDDYPR